MHEAFFDFIRHGRALAEQKGVNWEFDLDDKGRAFPGWNLTEIAGGLPPAWHLRDLGQDEKILQQIISEGSGIAMLPLIKTQLGKNWQDLIKAAVCEQLLLKRNTPGHIVQCVARPLRVLATISGTMEPWDITVDIVLKALELANKSQPSGGLAEGIFGVTKTVFDTNHLAKACPIYSLLPMRRRSSPSRKSRSAKTKEQLLDDLDDRKRKEKLPEKRAFWELIRIIFTEQPKSFTDVLRFAAIKTMVVTGLRVGEAVLLPVDWKRNRDYYDPSGRPAGELGGYSRSLMLRHFAEKQQSEHSNNTILFEATQPIPEMFAEILTESLDEVAKITEPLRKTLGKQIATGRLLPWYEMNELVPINVVYTHLTGNPIWLDIPKKLIRKFSNIYGQKFDAGTFAKISKDLGRMYVDFAGSITANMGMYMFYKRMLSKPNSPILRDAKGRETQFNKIWYSSCEVYFRVDEVERYLADQVPTKLPDTNSLKLDNGELLTSDLLFLLPKRSLAEERNDGITDITRCYSIGMPSVSLLTDVLGVDKGIRKTLFEVYGTTEEDRKLVLRSHSLRHLQNTELFRLGVADTIITKRFNRKSVAQSYEYDHRSLAEQLDSIELPPEVEASLGSKASTVARLIKTGKATGPFVDSFKRIQLSEGDEAAFEFLKVEADGFHATPYGHCINSFTVDPCPKNLECFAGCCHLTATNLPENQRHLRSLEARLKSALSEISSRPMNSVGKANQIAHATVRLDAVRKLCNTPTGQRVFPDGPDLSLPSPTRSVLDG